MDKIKFYIRILWIALILVGLMLFFLFPNYFSQESISIYIKKNTAHIFVSYIIVSLLRGFFLLPSTPFIFAGILLFPDSPLSVFLISITVIIVTAMYLYYASRYLEFNKIFSKTQSKKTTRIITQLNKQGFWVVLGWSFFPLVPTDLICYVAGSIRMNFKKYISAVFVGESILIGIYIYFGQKIL